MFYHARTTAASAGGPGNWAIPRRALLSPASACACYGHRIPPAEDSAVVLVASHAPGWHLDDELAGFERVVTSGYIIHSPGAADVAAEEQQHRRLIDSAWNYRFARYREADGWKREYWKQLPATGSVGRPATQGASCFRCKLFAFNNPVSHAERTP